MSFLIAYIFQRWAKFDKFITGLTAGLLIGFLLALSYDLYFLASMHMFSKSALIVDVIASTVITGIVSAVIAWVLGFKSKEVPAS
jgi:uncharacterized membrane protein